MILCSVIVDIAPTTQIIVAPLAGLFAWITFYLLFPFLRPTQKIQISLFIMVGLLLLAIGINSGVQVSVTETVSRNTAMISMILSVGFLKLVLLDSLQSNYTPPTGPRAFVHTLFAVAIFGSVINISAPIIINDRLSAQKSLSEFAVRSICRVFCACSTFSPFFAGMALVLTYVGDVRLLYVMLGGLPFLLLTLLLVSARALIFDAELVSRFQGYPLRLSSLFVPAALALAVVLATLLYPALSILTVISVASLLLTVVLLLPRGVVELTERVRQHIQVGIPQAVNEVMLFVAAGLLASGLIAFVQSRELLLPVSSFGPWVASALLAFMVVVAAIGLHPIIQISVLTPLILITQPQPELLALTYLFAWGLGTMASPLSGTHLVMQGRYGFPAWRLAVGNWGFSLVMYSAAVALLHAFSAMTAGV